MFSRTSMAFILINFGITWGAWGSVILLNQGQEMKPGSIAFILYILGGLLGPVVAAIMAKRMYSEKADFKAFLLSTIKVKVHLGWYALAVIAPLVLTLLPRFTNWPFSESLNLSTSEPFYISLLTLPMMVIAGGLEEVGWRGLLLPELLQKKSTTIATITVSLIWALWHLPLWFIIGTSQNQANFASFTVGAIGLSMVLTVIYLKSNSILLCILFHAFFNSFQANIGPTVFTSTEAEWLAELTKLLVCSIIFLLFLRSDFKKSKITKTVSQ